MSKSKATIESLTKEDGASPDMVQENIERLRAIFPEVFADGRIDFDALKQTLGDYVDEGEERYSFTWHGKSQARRIAQRPSTGTLRPCLPESVNWDTTENIFIEGDNLEVLKLLQKSYHRKVKMIYIDPPYNTGKEFIYPDKWQDNLETYLRYSGQVDEDGFKLSANSETSGRYHTNWLNMMYPRLRLSRNLLRDDGVIFVSIDYREAANLRLMMNEIFGEENLVFDVAVVNNLKGRNDREGIATCHESLLIYRKRNYRPRGLSLTKDKLADYDQVDELGRRFQWRDLRKRGGADTRTERPKMYVSLYVCPQTGGVAESSSSEYSVEVLPMKSDGEEGCWRWGKDKIRENMSILRGKQVAASGRWNIAYRVYLESEDGQRRSTPKSVWMGPQYSTDSATKALSRHFPGIDAKRFTPKPIGLLRDIIDQSTHDGDLVLDFFAGTGSLVEALLEQDAAEGTCRRFIAVQLPEPIDDSLRPPHTEVSTVAALWRERIRRCIGDKSDEDPRLGFRAFRLASSNIRAWDASFDTIERDLSDAIDNSKDDRSERDVLYELLLKYGLDLATPTDSRVIDGRTVTVIGAGALVACLADDITLDVVEGIAALKAELRPEVMHVVFKDSGFKDDVVKTNAAQILRQAGVDDVKTL